MPCNVVDQPPPQTICLDRLFLFLDRKKRLGDLLPVFVRLSVYTAVGSCVRTGHHSLVVGCDVSCNGLQAFFQKFLIVALLRLKGLPTASEVVPFLWTNVFVRTIDNIFNNEA
ncbi:MAG: hypothetical protein [Cressdnaviricota sp.]|nr:MAG: hypothetical protein [Cressdnaviricota sp.]